MHLADGSLVRSVRQVRRGDGILIRVSDGAVDGTVRSTKEDAGPGQGLERKLREVETEVQDAFKELGEGGKEG